MKQQLLLLITVAFLSPCLIAAPPSDSETVARTLVLDGEEISVAEVGGITSWVCFDYLSRETVLVETGYFDHADWNGTGFVLYDGSDEGEFTSYERRGMERQWDWGPDGNDYAFAIRPDGTGVYNSDSFRDMYSCEKR